MGLRHVLSWPKLGLEPKFYEAGTFGGFGKSAKTVKIHVLYVRFHIFSVI